MKKSIVYSIAFVCMVLSTSHCFGKLVYGKAPTKEEIEQAQRTSKNIFKDGELVIVRLDREKLYKEIGGFAVPDKYTVGKILGGLTEGTDQLRKTKMQGYEVKREKYTLLPYPAVRTRIGFYAPDQIGKTPEKKKPEKKDDKDKKIPEKKEPEKKDKEEDELEDDDEVEWEEDDVEWGEDWGESGDLTPEELRELLRG